MEVPGGSLVKIKEGRTYFVICREGGGVVPRTQLRLVNAREGQHQPRVSWG